MKERGIPFIAEMSRAVRAGVKTQTRRIMRVQPPADAEEVFIWFAPDLPPDVKVAQDGCYCRTPRGLLYLASSPYGKPGDRLYVKESWRTAKSLDTWTPKQIGERALDAGWTTPWAPIKYEADGATTNWDDWGDEGRIRSPRFMPRWAARTFMEIVAVRAQRVRDISESDAKAEGCDYSNEGWRGEYGPGFSRCATFRDLWNSIHAHDGHGWDANDWVFAYLFRLASRQPI